MARERALLLPWGESQRSTGREGGRSPGNKNVDDDDNHDQESEKVS